MSDQSKEIKVYSVKLDNPNFLGTANIAKTLKTSIHEPCFICADVILKSDHDRVVAEKDEKIKMLTEALEFYADKNNWLSHELTSKVYTDIRLSDADKIYVNENECDCEYFGRKLARETLKKVRGEK